MIPAKKLNKKFAKKLASVPLEYQASVYAKEMKTRYEEKQNQDRENLVELRNLLKSLKEKLQKEDSEESRANLLKKIEIQKNIIKRAPHPRCKWSPILPGSFESNSR